MRVRRFVVLNTSLTHDHRARLGALAEHHGVSLSDMLRRLIDEAFRALYPSRRLTDSPILPPLAPDLAPDKPKPEGD